MARGNNAKIVLLTLVVNSCQIGDGTNVLSEQAADAGCTGLYAGGEMCEDVGFHRYETRM